MIDFPENNLGFKRQALRSLRKTSRSLTGEDKAGVDFICGILKRATVFTAPPFGVFSDRRTGVYQHVLKKTAHSAVALEYAVEGRENQTSKYEDIKSSKRISLFWDWDGRLPRGRRSDQITSSEAICIASICYVDHVGRWMPIPLVMVLPRNFDVFRVDQNKPFVQEMIASGRVSERNARNTIKPCGGISLLPSAMARGIRLLGETEFMNCMSHDMMDEVNACFDFHRAMLEKEPST